MTLSVALLGTDLIGQARTGTGKTLAFGIPLLQRTVAPHDPDHEDLAAPDKPQALVVAPTRELAVQVANDLKLAATDRGTRILTIYGGMPYEPQLDALKAGVEVVVGTPGRLLDLANRGALDLSHVKVLVLDEADEMLDLGFLPDVERILSKTPATRQTMLFSATMPGAIVALARTHMRHPVNIRAESAAETHMVPATAQFIYQVHDLDKVEMLARILQAENSGLTICFTRTKRQAQRVADDLAERGFPTSPLHGDMAQVAREKAMAKFREGKVRVLVATDVAARGIDVQNVTHVINYNCPEDDSTYVHRIGRTGRAGATGVAITFVDWADVTRWKVINKTLGLPFEELAETYSTSEHFFHDLGIPRDAKPRVGPPVETPGTTIKARGGSGGSSSGGRSGGSGRSGGRDSDAGSSGSSAERPARNRNRTRSRTRSGQSVDGAAPSGDSTGSSAPAPSTPAAEGSADRPPRKRNRRRSSGSGAGAAASTAGD
ncbi:DEAD/DEAH box helicase [Nocardioides sp. HDW12B]|uniref:DEAD/DEAH box helicase n=1 Tax=Nocardioides sp. HDW12B TaxID=2714939 RepID=UPI00140BE866|nr:DEAD/DEAH box helicase [Nocardioides sp. HDW12B]QIK67421.1 DEAD/DEAH box helicase [Nocardioides sp. HDW12B]